MTHPTDDEIMELAGAWFHTGENQKRDDGYYYRSLGTPSNVRGSDLIEFARALLAEQARTDMTKVWVISYNGVLQPTLYYTEEAAAKEVKRRQDEYPHDKSPRAVVPMWAAPLLKAEQDKDAAEDAELLDWLDSTNKRFKMGWKVGVAPAGNCSVQSVIFLGNSEPVTIRAAIRAARAAERKA